MISQCISGLLVLAALAGGVGLGFGAANFLAFRRAVQHNQMPQPEPQPALSHIQSATRQLPGPQTYLPAVYLSVEPPAQIEEADHQVRSAATQLAVDELLRCDESQRQTLLWSTWAWRLALALLFAFGLFLI